MRELNAPEEITHRGATHIVKSFDPKEYPELAANEFICMRGAAAAGIQTPRVQLSMNRRFLVVDRFDLAAADVYLGVEDFCVLNARRAHGRYDGSYEGIAKRITDYVSASALARAKEQFALMVVYSCAVGNGDAHLKNFSVPHSSTLQITGSMLMPDASSSTSVPSCAPVSIDSRRTEYCCSYLGGLHRQDHQSAYRCRTMSRSRSTLPCRPILSLASPISTPNLPASASQRLALTS